MKKILVIIFILFLFLNLKPEILMGQQISIPYDSLVALEENKYSVENIKNLKLCQYCKSLFTVYADSFHADLLSLPSAQLTKKEFQVNCCNCFVDISSQPFDSKRHKVTFIKPYQYLIDGKIYWGGDGTLPINEIGKFKVVINNETLSVPKSVYSDLFEPNLGCFQAFDESGNSAMHCYSKVYKSQDEKYLFIFMANSDGAGSYEVIFIFEDGKYIQRVIERPF